MVLRCGAGALGTEVLLGKRPTLQDPTNWGCELNAALGHQASNLSIIPYSCPCKSN